MDRLPEPRMEGVRFGLVHLAAGEHLHFGVRPLSWFFQVRKGAMEIRFADQPPVRVAEGSCIGFDGRRSFAVVEPSARPGGRRDFDALEPWSPAAGAPLRLVVGHAPLAANLLLESFWSVIHVPAEHPGPAASWIPRLVDLIELELSADHARIDRAGVLQRLAELIIFTLVRHMTEEEAAIRESLPMALQDSRIWRALSAFHQAPAAHWTVEGLARIAGMSRTALAVRFRELVGESPLHCLTRLRMDMAADMLRRDDAPVKAIAEKVGYGTEAAFNRAFVRKMGTTPGRWRNQHDPMRTGLR